MKNILIISLGTSHDLITSSHLISSLKKDSPNDNIELLTLEAHKDLAGIINHLSSIHYINTDLIQNIMQNPLYSDAFAANEFMDVITPLSQTKWDKVINYSNDDVSAFLVSAIENKEIVGTYINTAGAPRNANKWGNYQNAVASGLSRLPIDKISIRNHMANVPLYNDNEKIKSHPDYSMVASQNFGRIRQMKGSPATFIVGINLESGYDGYTLDMDTYTDMIEALEESPHYKPVLLLNGKNLQRKLANDLNKQFDDKLISINIETIALPSVLTNLDALISTSNDQLAIADTMEVKCLELRDLSGKTYSPITINSENYVIYTKESQSLSSDILLALNEEFGTELPIDFMNSQNPVYKSVQDEYGNFFTQIRGDLKIQNELRYHIERSFFYQTLGYPKNDELFTHIKQNTEHDQLMSFIAQLKSELTSTVKILLATLRSLKGVKNSKNNLNSFIGYLDNLMAIGRTDTIVSSIIRKFEGQVENIEANDIDANIKAIETNLFELKSELQALTTIMTDLTQDKRIEKSAPVNANLEA